MSGAASTGQFACHSPPSRGCRNPTMSRAQNRPILFDSPFFFFFRSQLIESLHFFQIFSVFFPVVILRLEVRKEGRKAKAEKGRDEAGHS